MASNVDFYIAQGDTHDPLEVVLQHDDGSVVDLTSASVRFEMVQVGGDEVSIESDVVAESSADATGSSGIDIDTPADGAVTYHWADGDTDTSGYYNSRFLVDYDGNTGVDFDSDQSFPNVDYLTVKIDSSL